MTLDEQETMDLHREEQKMQEGRKALRDWLETATESDIRNALDRAHEKARQASWRSRWALEQAELVRGISSEANHQVEILEHALLNRIRCART